MKKKQLIETKILVALAFFSVGVGLWGNFRQLWLQDNTFNVQQISTILSIGSFFSAIALLICATKLKLHKIQDFITGSLLLKIVVMLLLYLLNQTNLKLILNILIIIDVVLEKFIISSIYPLILTIEVSDQLYSKRKLVEYLFRDVGILMGGLFIGKQLSRVVINYNICLFISAIFIYISFWVIASVKVKSRKINSEISFSYLFKDKMIKSYLICYFIGTIAMNTGLGLKMLMLTNKLSFTANTATNYLLVIGLFADILGIIALRYLTPKNDYLTVSIKFGIRFALYIFAFFANNNLITFIAITWSILISTAYENVVDAPYINRIDKKYQLFFTDIRYMIGMFAESIGLFLAGVTYQYGLHCMLGLSAFFMIFQIIISYRLIDLRLKEDKK